MKVVKVRFKKVGKLYHFGVGKLDIKLGDNVIVETVRGLEYAMVVSDAYEIEEKDLAFPLKDVIRIATKDDEKKYLDNIKKQDAVIEFTKELVKKNELEMKVVASEFTLDGSKLIISFEAENRIDFRELVKQLASKYRLRIELRQIGARDSAKIIGGIGICGLVYCCKTFIGEFQNISMKMAKNQGISLASGKIFGPCSKLLCCIKYEDEMYTEANKKAPNTNIKYMLNGNVAEIVSVDPLAEKATLKFNNKYFIKTFEEIKALKIVKENKKHASKK